MTNFDRMTGRWEHTELEILRHIHSHLQFYNKHDDEGPSVDSDNMEDRIKARRMRAEKKLQKQKARYRTTRKVSAVSIMHS